MRDWHHKRPTDLALRLLGLALCTASWLSIRALLDLHAQSAVAPPPPAAYALAAIGFVGGSAGSALAVLGHHLFDRVEISERWRTYQAVDLTFERKVADRREPAPMQEIWPDRLRIVGSRPHAGAANRASLHG